MQPPLGLPPPNKRLDCRCHTLPPSALYSARGPAPLAGSTSILWILLSSTLTRIFSSSRRKRLPVASTCTRSPCHDAA